MVLSHWFDKHIFFYSSPKKKGRNSLHSHRTGNNTTYGLAPGLRFLIFHHNTEWRGLGRLCAHPRGHHTDPLQWQHYVDKARPPQDAGMLQALMSMWHGSFTSGDQPVTWGQDVDYTEPLPSWECQEFTLLETNMYYWNGLIFYASKSSLNITTWGLRGGLISPGMGTAGPETQEMWDWGQNCGTHWLCSSHTPGSWPEADTLVEHSQGPARQHSQQLRGAKTTLVPKEEQFCRVVHAPQLFLCGSGQIRLYLRPHPCLALSVSFFFLFLETWEIFVPQPGIEPMLPALKAWSLHHWTAREAPLSLCLSCFLPSFKSFSWRNVFPSTNYGALNSFFWLCSFRTQYKTTSPPPSKNAPERGSVRKWNHACSGY